MSASDDLPTPPGVPKLTPARKPELELLQPFGHDVCANWRDAVYDSEVPMNEGALQSLRVLEAEGRVTLLNAPRAGHGKTHLLGRVARRLQGDAVVAGLPWMTLEGLDWEHTGKGIIRDLARAGKNPTALQQVVGGVLATLLRRLIQTGRIPSTDPVQALRVLAQDPMQLFRESGPASVIGSWFRRHFEQLVKPLAEASGQEGPDALEGWIKPLFAYLEDPSSAAIGALETRLQDESAVEMSRFIRLVTSWKPLVLVADHMDGLYRDPQAGVAIARMALALVTMPGVHVVLSMNQDLWETTFGGQLPSALEDRLNSWSVPLRGPTLQEAQALLDMRLQDAGVEDPYARGFLSFLDLERFFTGRAVGSVSARALLRHAAQGWRHWLQAGAPVVSHEPQPQIEEPVIPPGGFLLDAPVQEAPTSTAPPPPESAEPAPSTAEPEEFPSLGLDDDDAESEDEDALKRLAQHLARDSGGTVVDLATGPGALPPATQPPPDIFNIVPVAPSAPAPGAAPSSSPAPPQGLSSPAAMSGPGLEASAAGPTLSTMEPATFQRLRTMLAQVKTPAGPERPAGAAQPANGELQGSQAAGLSPESSAAMLSRFEQARREISVSGRAAQVELPVLTDLVRLAGKRFPVVTYDEIELPGLLGRSLPRWTLQGMEIIFGLQEFSDARYWRTVSTYVAGRIAELQVLSLQSGEAPPQSKLVVFKGDLEGPSLVELLKDEVIPTALRNHVDAVHLDARSLASLYAMHHLVRETETGALQADTTTVLGTLANELDFFWKRLTKPKS